MTFLEHKRKAAIFHDALVSLDDCLGGVFGLHGEMLGASGEQRAGCQAHQIHSVGVDEGFIEIVDSPDKAAVGVLPSAEVFHVEIAHGQETGNAVQIGADLGPNLHPAIEGGAKKRENSGGHLLVFELQIGLDNADVLAQPLFIPSGCFDNVHSG